MNDKFDIERKDTDLKNRRFCAMARHTWAVGDTIDDVKKNLYDDFKDCIVYSIEPPCPTWVDGMGTIMTNKAEGQKEFSKVFPVLDLRRRDTKKKATSTKELYEKHAESIDSGRTDISNQQ